MSKTIYIELGSEFDLELNSLEPKIDNIEAFLSQYNKQWYDLGRSALKSIGIPERKKILLPEYICESVIKVFDLDKVEFYRIDKQFNIDEDDLLNRITSEVGVIYVAHYFGYCQPKKTLNRIRTVADENNCIIIEDTTQSFFSCENVVGDYVVASLRKWIPIPQGAVLYSKKELPDISGIKESIDNQRCYGMILKNLFLEKGMEFNKQYREIFEECENKIDEGKEIKLMSQMARFLMSCIDVPEVINKRIDNKNYLLTELGKRGVFPARYFEPYECPLCVPLRIKNRDKFRQYLIENRVFCAVHWPFDNISPEQRESAIENANTLISIPIDQRYGKQHMDYLIDKIVYYGGDLLF